MAPFRSAETNFALMSTRDFMDFYGIGGMSDQERGELASSLGDPFSGTLDVFTAHSMKSYHFGDGSLTGYTTYAYSNRGGQVNHYRLDGSGGGFGSGLMDGFVGGLSSSWEFVKGLATVDGWIGLGEGLLDVAHMASNTPGAVLKRAQIGAGVVNAAGNIPNMSAYELGYATGYGVEKAAEAIALSKGAGAAGNVAKGSGNLWKVGSYNKLAGLESGLNAHHVGQKALMKKYISGYNWRTAPSILVPETGHIIKSSLGIVSRSAKGITSARQVLARDIFELRRVYGPQNIPNSSLQELIQLNKQMYPGAFIK